jgi:hypothetical protein
VARTRTRSSRIGNTTTVAAEILHAKSFLEGWEVERPRHAMDASKNNSYAHGDGDGKIPRIIVGEFGRVKCGRSERYRIMETVGYEHIAEGTEE